MRPGIVIRNIIIYFIHFFFRKSTGMRISSIGDNVIDGLHYNNMRRLYRLPTARFAHTSFDVIYKL